jgi:hypothetical protein
MRSWRRCPYPFIMRRLNSTPGASPLRAGRCWRGALPAGQRRCWGRTSCLPACRRRCSSCCRRRLPGPWLQRWRQSPLLQRWRQSPWPQRWHHSPWRQAQWPWWPDLRQHLHSKATYRVRWSARARTHPPSMVAACIACLHPCINTRLQQAPALHSPLSPNPHRAHITCLSARGSLRQLAPCGCIAAKQRHQTRSPSPISAM